MKYHLEDYLPNCDECGDLIQAPLQVGASIFIEVPPAAVFTVVTDPYQMTGRNPHQVTVHIPDKAHWLDQPVASQRIFYFFHGGKTTHTITYWDADNTTSGFPSVQMQRDRCPV